MTERVTSQEIRAAAHAISIAQNRRRSEPIPEEYVSFSGNTLAEAEAALDAAAKVRAVGEAEDKR